MCEVSFENDVKVIGKDEIRIINYSVYNGTKTITKYDMLDLKDLKIRQALITLGWTPPKRFCRLCGNAVRKCSNSYLNQEGDNCYSVRCANCGSYYIRKEGE